MAENSKVVKFWRGTRAAYNELGAANKLDFWTRYSVLESDGRRNEYFGTNPVVPATGELYPVIDVVSTLPTTLNVGDRYLVGHDATDSVSAEYYVVEIAADFTQSTINPLGSLSVRIDNRHMWRYQVVNGKLISYDQIIDCGEF